MSPSTWPVKPGELTAYSILVSGFATLVLLLRADFGMALFDKERFFFTVPDSMPAPTLRVELADWGGEQLLRLHTENFRFANYCQTAEIGQSLSGHAHLYVNGRKVASIYEPMTFLPKLPTGKHRITISLNVLPDHRAILVGSTPVSADVVIHQREREILNKDTAP